MPTPLQTLRAALRYEMALGGPFVPFGAPLPATEAAATEAAATEAAATEAAATEAAATETPVSSPPLPPTEAAMPTHDLFGHAVDPTRDPTRSPYERIAALIPEDSPLRDMKTLEEVEEYARTHVLTPIDEARQNLVFGVGNPHADLMIIGEAPGADEDRKGEPFVGRAGQLLNKILAAINFGRDEVYITNILKSRPPGNRDPLPEETAAHLPLLYKQIALVKPKILLAVGRTAGNALLGRKSSLASLRGKFHDFYGLPLMVTYHPAALLRNPQWKRPTWEDVKLLRTRYDQLVG